MNHLRMKHLTAILAVVPLVMAPRCFCDEAAAQPPAISVQVRQFLNAVSAQHGPITVRWTDTLSPGEGDVPPEITRYPVAFQPQEFGFTWQNGCVYFFMKQNTGPIGQVAFDGTNVYIGHPSIPVPGKTPTVHTISRLTLSNSTRGTWAVNPDFLTGMGIRVPLSAADLRKDVLQSDIAALLETGARVLDAANVSVEGRPLIRIVLQAEDPEHARAMRMTRANIEAGARGSLMSKSDIEALIAKAEMERAMPEFRQYIFELDPSLNGAVCTREERAGGHLLQHTRNGDFRQCGASGLWIPMVSMTQYYTSSDLLPGRYFDRPILVRNIKVVDFSISHVPKEDFALDFSQPGTRVIQSGPNGVSTVYVVPASSEELDRVLASSDVAGAMHPWRRLILWAVVFVLVSLCGFLGVAWLLRRKSASQRGTR